MDFNFQNQPAFCNPQWGIANPLSKLKLHGICFYILNFFIFKLLSKLSGTHFFTFPNFFHLQWAFQTNYKNKLSKTSNHISSQANQAQSAVWSGRHVLASELAVCHEANDERNPLTNGNERNKPITAGGFARKF